jgi:hypothetical protein
MKAEHGSYKDEVASPDELGSFLVSHVNRTSGPESWDKIRAGTAKWSWNPFALSASMKNVTGRGAGANYDDTMSDLGERWESKAAEMEFSQPAIVNTEVKSVFTGYYQPVFEADGGVLAQKIGMDSYPVEVVRLRPDGREQKLFRFTPSVMASNRTSVVKGLMVWDEYVPDVRWLRGYSEILIRDLAAGRTSRLTHKNALHEPGVVAGCRAHRGGRVPSRAALLTGHTGCQHRRRTAAVGVSRKRHDPFARMVPGRPPDRDGDSERRWPRASASCRMTRCG